MPALHHYQETNPRLGTPSGLCRERSLRAYDGVVNVVGEPKSRDCRLSQALARPVVKKGVFRRSRKWMIRLGGKFKFGVVSRVYLLRLPTISTNDQGSCGAASTPQRP